MLSKLAATNRFVQVAASVALLSLVSFGGAKASTVFSIEGGTGGILGAGATNPFDLPIGDLVEGVTAITIFNSANAASGGLFMNPGNTVLAFTYLGSEAGFQNANAASFSFAGNEMFNNTKTAVGNTAFVNFSEGVGKALVPFLFRSISNANSEAINGGPISPNVRMAFVQVGLDLVYALFDDIATGDGDFDDLVVRISVAPPGGAGDVPLPPALVLFGSALVGLTLLARRRRGTPPVGRVAA